MSQRTESEIHPSLVNATCKHPWPAIQILTFSVQKIPPAPRIVKMSCPVHEERSTIVCLFSRGTLQCSLPHVEQCFSSVQFDAFISRLALPSGTTHHHSGGPRSGSHTLGFVRPVCLGGRLTPG